MAEADFSQYIDPAAYQRARQAQEQANALLFAKMSPAERANVAGYQFGGALGRAAGGLFGVKDRGLEEVTAASEIMKGVDRTDPKALYAAAKTLGQQGYMNAGEAVFKQAQALEAQQAALEGIKAKTGADIARGERETAMAERALADARRLSREEGFKNLPPEVQTILLMEQRDPEFDAKKAMQDYLNKKGAKQVSEPYQRGGAWVQRDLVTGEEKQIVPRAPVTNVNTGGPNKPLSTTDIKEINKLRTSVNIASSNVTKADEFITGLEQGVAKFGATSNMASNLRTLFGSSTEGDRFKQNVEKYTVAAVNAVLNMAKGPQTDQDAERARQQIMTGLQKNDTKSVLEGLKSLRQLHSEIFTNDSESLNLFGQERGRELTPKKNTAKPGTKENPIPLD